MKVEFDMTIRAMLRKGVVRETLPTPHVMGGREQQMYSTLKPLTAEAQAVAHGNLSSLYQDAANYVPTGRWQKLQVELPGWAIA